MRLDLPSGTVTFLFTDVEGSTRLLHELGDTSYAEALAEHRRVLREDFGASGGVEVDTQGDAFFVAFPTAPAALDAAAAALTDLAEGPIRIRIGIHSGTPRLTDEGYVGIDVHRAARIAAAGHGGQVLLSAATAHLVRPQSRLSLLDLGEHRLKDLSAPERIYQLGDDEFPPLKSLYRTNLPIPATPFLGRERELGEVVQLGSQDRVRLLTLTGPGGTGKTRLALQAAAELSDRYPDGLWWVPLAALRDPGLVIASATQAVGAKDGLAEHIADTRLLLLFDNFEHLLEAAVELAGLLASCPNLDLLVTSREPLHVSGEQEYAVPPLAHEDAIQFFLARARAVRPEFESDDAVPEICRRLDELPLALELAAARVKALSSRQILERLEQRLSLLTGGSRDVPERQRTLQATIEWSYELLNEDEQRVFARLAVFRGGCTLAAAELIAKADLDILQSLVDKSLLRQSEERYWMLETIREYASGRLEESGDAGGLRRRHARHFLAFAEEAYPHMRDASLEWFDRVERDHDNLRAAFDELEASGEGEPLLRLAGAVARFWDERTHYAEGRRRLDQALALDDRPTSARANALVGAAALAVNVGDLAAGRLKAEEALELNRELEIPAGTAWSCFFLGIAIMEEGDTPRARDLFDESVQLFRGLGDEHSALWAARCLAWAYAELGDSERSGALHEDNLRRARELGNEIVEAISLGALAVLAVRGGRVGEARSLIHESLSFFRGFGDLRELALHLIKAAYVLAHTGRPSAAAQLLSCAEVLGDEIGVQDSWYAGLDEARGAISAQLDEAVHAEAAAQGRALTPDEAVLLALDASA